MGIPYRGQTNKFCASVILLSLVNSLDKRKEISPSNQSTNVSRNFMTDPLPQVDELSKSKLESSLLDAHSYWLKKRLIFNLVVGGVGLLATINYAKVFTLFDFIGIVLWGFVANGLYSFGYVIESYMITKYPKVKFSNVRFLLFYVGTFIYSLVTVIYAQEYFLNYVAID